MARPLQRSDPDATSDATSAIHPFGGIRYDPGTVKLGGVLAPPYDVISDEQRQQLYGRDLRNIVRIDYGVGYEDDVAGRNDRYTRASEHLKSWLELGILRRDDEPAFYISDHEFVDVAGAVTRRRGIFGSAAALPWDRAPVRPHERTLRGPKEDRMRLLHATRTHTSAVFAMWTGAGDIGSVIDRICLTQALAGGRTDGEMGSEKHVLWRAVGRDAEAISLGLSAAALYVADGHHRYETAAVYATQHGDPQSTDPAAVPCLLYMCAADDPALQLLPTHRLVRPAPDLPTTVAALTAVLGGEWEATASPNLSSGAASALAQCGSHHAYAVQLADGVLVVRSPRLPAVSPRAALDTVVLEDKFLGPLGLTPETIREGALGYSREVRSVEAAVHSGEAVMGIVVNAARTSDVIAVADAGETMPQKSTYFYPKVPTGLVLAPAG